MANSKNHLSISDKKILTSWFLTNMPLNSIVNYNKWVYIINVVSFFIPIKYQIYCIWSCIKPLNSLSKCLINIQSGSKVGSFHIKNKVIFTAWAICNKISRVLLSKGNSYAKIFSLVSSRNVSLSYFDKFLSFTVKIKLKIAPSLASKLHSISHNWSK